MKSSVLLLLSFLALENSWFSAHLAAQTVKVDSVGFLADGALRLSFQAEAANYYILHRGDSVTNINFPLQMILGIAPTPQLEDRTATPFSAQSAYYRITAVPTNAPLDVDGDQVNDLAELVAGTNPVLAPSLVINELDYDQVSTDTQEFLEIYNPTSNHVSLASLSLILINGGNNQQYYRTNLTGSLAPGQYLVLCNTSLVAQLPAGTTTLTIPDSTIQNGAPDGVLLLDLRNNGIVDALSYEGSITNAVVPGLPTSFNLVEGTATTVVDAPPNEARSMIRNPNGADSNNAQSDWSYTSSKTPGAANIHSP